MADPEQFQHPGERVPVVLQLLAKRYQTFLTGDPGDDDEPSHISSKIPATGWSGL